MNTTVTARKKTAAETTVLTICLILPPVLGTTICYAGGALRGFSVFGAFTAQPPTWTVAAIIPLMFFFMGICLYDTLRQNAYTRQAARFKGTSLILWFMVFSMLCAFPFILYAKLLLPAYIYICILAAESAALTIINFKISPLSVFTASPALIYSVYLAVIMFFVVIA